LHHQPACYLYFSLAVVPGLTQHFTVASLLFTSVLMICHFHLFVLKQKGVAQKFKANPNRSVRFAAHAQQHPTAFCTILLPTTVLHPVYNINFFNCP
jgi:hypothetical protein